MCDRFNRNRAELSKLIFKIKCFDKDQLFKIFFDERKGDVVIDGSQTISDYLEELTDIGILEYQYGKYQVIG